MASIQKRILKNGETAFRVQVRLKGYEVQRATFDRLTDARKWAQSTEAALRERRHFKTSEAKKYTVADMISRYMAKLERDNPKRLNDVERLHNNAMVLNGLYDSFKIATTEQEKKEKVNEYHRLILSCPENHEPCDEALFRASHRHEFGVGCCEAKRIKVTNFINTYWLYATLVLLPLLVVIVII